MFEPFPRLQYVCISFNKLRRRKNEILAMFNAHPEIEKYWKEKEFPEDEPMDTA